MFNALRKLNPNLPVWKALWWRLLATPCYAWMLTCYRHRTFGAHNIPLSGPVLYVSNHQSMLDPIIVGITPSCRSFCAMARSSLFRNPIFAWLIYSLNAIPVERGSSDMAAMRRCLEALAEQKALLVFPEGTRTNDGTIGPFKPGTMLLIKRGKPKIVPVAIEGAQKAWPRHKLLRPYGRIAVSFGEPITADELLAKRDEALSYLRERVEALQQELRARMT